jgi:cytochrome c oxidase subunit 2
MEIPGSVPERKASCTSSHDNKLEIVWTAIPAVVMAFLVISGLDAWNEVMADVGEG